MFHWKVVVSFWNPHGGSRELAFQSCPLTFIYAIIYTHPYKYTNVKLLRIGVRICLEYTLKSDPRTLRTLETIVMSVVNLPMKAVLSFLVLYCLRSTDIKKID